ncbi:MAG: ATP-grasp domain-containing protein [Deltaproteobacteria bacterium]|nr:ATP-grasp domain-containing protein [Deltaproteobacteria bacterium]
MSDRAIKTIAVVNRGEAAVRFLRALKDYNLERGTELTSVALYTDPDRLTPFVRLADHAVALGPALTRGADGALVSTYTDHDKVLDAIARAGADAVWPGWGFVAEDAAFVEKLEARGITFIGPPSAAMRRLGDKISAKELAIEAGVPLAPWHRIGEHEDEAVTRAAAEQIGYPLVVKAAAGGGGRGIRVVRHPAQLGSAIAAVRDEARRSFRAGALFLEACVTSARHIEVQLVVGADGRGATLGIRDCTVQRRHQKVIEEAPSPVVNGEMSHRLESAAVRLGELSGYRGVGTVEFLVDPARDLAHFLEVNTRLQVEHTVTEAVRGVDLVHTMIDIARGLPWCGSERVPEGRGHAIEVRLNAEDPERGFQPAPGRVRLFRPPLGPGIRIDSGIAEGVSIAPEFDSMVAKLIAYGADRPQALARLRRALRELELVVEDGTTNKSFLLELLDDPAVVQSTADTGWLDRRQADARAITPPGTFEALCAAAVLVRRRQIDRSVGAFMRDVQNGIPYPLALGAGLPIDMSLRGAAYTFEAYALGGDRWLAGPTGESPVELTLEPTGSGSMSLVMHGKRMTLLEAFGQSGLALELDGTSHQIELASGGRVTSPMPALVVKVHVAEGQAVEVGERLVTLEAMKMEVPVLARQKGVVGAVSCRAQEQVGVGHVLLTLEEDGAKKGTETRQSGQRTAFVMPDLPLLGRALLLGYEVGPRQRELLMRSLEGRGQPGSAGPPGEGQADGPLEGAWTVGRLAALVTIFGDLVQTFDGPVAFGDPASAPVRGEAAFFARCRAIASGREPEPSPDLEQRLPQALRHYGQAPMPETLWRLACANADAGGYRHRLINAVLRRLIALGWSAMGDLEDERELELALARTGEAARAEWVSVRDNARQARYVLFRRRRLAGPDDHVARLLAPTDEQPFDMAALVRSVYGTEAEVRVEPPALGATLRAIIAEGGVRVLAIATSAELGARALEGLAPRIAGFVEGGRAEVHLFVVGPIDDGDRLAGLVAAVPRLTNLTRIAATWTPDGQVERHRSFTVNGKVAEEQWLRDVHPERARRLELWRLEGFEATPLENHPGVLAFRLRARKNPRDERIIVFAELARPPRKGSTAADDPARRELEWVFGESLRIIRDAQAARRTSERYFLNRIVLHVGEVMDATTDELMAMARRLEGATRGLGLQKVVVACRLVRDGVPSRRVLSFAVRGRHRLELHEEVPSCAPIRAASEYHLKVETARRLGVVYPYEIIRALRGSEGADASLLPHPDMADGRFVELDLDDGGEALVPVDRPPGENQSGVVVGLVTHRTARYPEGMTRVWLGSDPTRSMGALAEPECRRIIAAIRLADAMRIPIEWLPVSSGARIAMDSGTENLDWTARTLRAIIEHTERGGVIHVIVAGVNVGAQSYWNAEATMLMHTRGVLIQTTDGAMVLTGKKALEVSGSVAAADERGIGGLERIMGPNGQAQYVARSLGEAYQILFRHYALTYVAPGATGPRRMPTGDPTDRSVLSAPATDGGFATVGEIFSEETNPGKKRPFAIRDVMRAVVDRDVEPLERFSGWEGAETAAVWEAQLGGFPVSLIGFESRSVPRRDQAPVDGPDRWSGGTLYPQSSRKGARALNQASGQRPVVVLANLSGFDGSPESMRKWQLEYGAEIGRAVVSFDGPLLFVVVGRYHGVAYVVFSKALNPRLVSLAVDGAYASVIGGGPAAAVVFPREVRRRTEADPRVVAARATVAAAGDNDARDRARAALEKTLADVTLEQQGLLAREFDEIHDVARAVRVGSLDGTIRPDGLRPELVGWLERLTT